MGIVCVDNAHLYVNAHIVILKSLSKETLSPSRCLRLLLHLGLVPL